MDDRKNTLGNIFSFKSRAISWGSNKKIITTLSTLKVEYIAITSSACQAIRFRRLVEGFHLEKKETTKYFVTVKL